MGLDQYAYAVTPTGEEHSIAQWRKHPNLHGWMEDLWHAKGRPGLPEGADPDAWNAFNAGVNLYLNEEELDMLEAHITNYALPHTEGFFFGASEGDAEEREYDLKFIEYARQNLRRGNRVFYTSWW